MKSLAINNQSAATAINDAGQVIINSVNDDGLAQAYIYELASDNFIPITNLDSETSSENGAFVVDINNNGDVLGYGLSAEGNLEAFIWKDNSIKFLGTLGGALSIPIAINDAGDVIGISETSTSEQLTGFIYKDGAINNLDAGQGFITLPQAFNENGEVVGIYAPIEGDLDPSLSSAFVWKDGDFTDLGSLGGSGTIPLDINERGQIIALSQNADEQIESVLWDSGNLEVLEQVAVSFDGKGNTINLINEVNEAADLSVTQTASSDSIIDGENITYTFAVINNGEHDAQGVKLFYTLPEGAAFVSSTITPLEQSDDNLTFEFGDLADGESTTVDITVNLSSVATDSFGTAQVGSNTYDPNDDNDFVLSSKREPDSDPQENLGSIVDRFFNPAAGVHFYTADRNESDYVRENLDNYQYEGESYMTVDPVSGDNPEEVYRFFNSTTGVHLYTTNEEERDYIIDNLSNFAYEDVKFHAYESEVEGSIPVHRFYEPTIGVHFYTPNEGEKVYVEENFANYSYEGIAYYAFPVNNTEIV